MYRLVQQAGTLIAKTEIATGADLPRFVKDEFDAFLQCGILAQGFLSLRYGDCGHDKLVTFSCKRRGFCPSCEARQWRRPRPDGPRHPSCAGVPGEEDYMQGGRDRLDFFK